MHNEEHILFSLCASGHLLGCRLHRAILALERFGHVQIGDIAMRWRLCVYAQNASLRTLFATLCFLMTITQLHAVLFRYVCKFKAALVLVAHGMLCVCIYIYILCFKG
jgi:hypothetical protein